MLVCLILRKLEIPVNVEGKFGGELALCPLGIKLSAIGRYAGKGHRRGAKSDNPVLNGYFVNLRANRLRIKLYNEP